MPWVLHTGISLTAKTEEEINWGAKSYTVDVFADNFVEAMKKFARRKECNCITISKEHKNIWNIWFKKIPTDLGSVQREVAQSWCLDGDEFWSHHEDKDFPGYDEHWIVWGDHDRTRVSFDDWDLDFVYAMQTYADSMSYQGLEITEQAVIFKKLSLADFREETSYTERQTKTWIKREACHGSRGLFAPMEQCILAVREDLVKETNKDPLPQFTSQQIADSTGFLSDAILAMQTFVNGFSEGNLAELSDEQLQVRQLKAREASRRLALLFGDAQHAFSGKRSQFAITQSQQASETREQLIKLQSLFQTFGQETWLGTLLATEEFATNQQMATDMLKGLLEPSKVSLADVPSAGDLVDSVLDALAQNLNSTQDGSIHQLNALVQVGQELSGSFQALHDRVLAKQREIDVKMEKLQFFAEKLMAFPAILNRYLLVRLGEIGDGQDLTILKQFIGQEEATQVHQLLEAFRDSATEEKAVRRMAAAGYERTILSSAASVASSNEFHVVSQ